MEPGDPQNLSPRDWVSRMLVFFVLAVIATAAAVAASSTNGASTLVATNAGVTVGPGQTSTARIVTSAPQPTITTGPLPTAPGNTAPAAGSWPSGTSGYTDVLQSVPTSEGRARAEAMARQAASAGLPQTGVLDSKSYRSLRSGYYVVFSGIYANPVQAAAALASAHARGFPGAYVARVSH